MLNLSLHPQKGTTGNPPNLSNLSNWDYVHILLHNSTLKKKNTLVLQLSSFQIVTDVLYHLYENFLLRNICRQGMVIVWSSCSSCSPARWAPSVGHMRGLDRAIALHMGYLYLNRRLISNKLSRCNIHHYCHLCLLEGHTELTPSPPVQSITATLFPVMLWSPTMLLL